MLWFMESQRVRHDWANELNWTERHMSSRGLNIGVIRKSLIIKPEHLCFQNYISHVCAFKTGNGRFILRRIEQDTLKSKDSTYDLGGWRKGGFKFLWNFIKFIQSSNIPLLLQTLNSRRTKGLIFKKMDSISKRTLFPNWCYEFL